jgi:hypothetical protein
MKALTAGTIRATIYPNPVKNILTVTLNEITAKASVSITNEQGSVLIKSENILNNKSSLVMDVSQLTAGIYFLNLQTTKGYQTLKFLKL